MSERIPGTDIADQRASEPAGSAAGARGEPRHGDATATADIVGAAPAAEPYDPSRRPEQAARGLTASRSRRGALRAGLEHPVLAATGLAFALASLASASNGLATWPAAVAAASVAAVTPALWAVDVREHRLPNPLTGAAAIGCGLALLLALVPGAVGGAGADAAGGVLHAVLGALAAAAVAALVFGALALTGGMGMGDAKLAPSLAAAAALVSLETALAAFALAFLAGGVAAIARLVARRDRRERLAFGPHLLAGFWAAWTVAVLAPTL